MAGPLLVCPSCSSHVLLRDAACPHCGATVRSGGKVLGRTAGAMLMGLALAGCPADDDTSDTNASSGSSGSPTTDPTDPTNGSTSDDSTGDPTNVTTSALYGGPATGELTSSTTDSTSSGGDTDTDTDGTTTGGGSTSISPDYGVPTTTGG